MSPQPARARPLALTRQLSKSAPSSPQHLPASPSDNPPGTPADKPYGVENARGVNGRDNVVPGGIQIPNRAGQQGWGGPMTHGGSEGGSLGPLNGVSLPDGYMADTEVAAARHRLHHSSISFTESGVVLVRSGVIFELLSRCTFMSGWGQIGNTCGVQGSYCMLWGYCQDSRPPAHRSLFAVCLCCLSSVCLSSCQSVCLYIRQSGHLSVRLLVRFCQFVCFSACHYAACLLAVPLGTL